MSMIGTIEVITPVQRRRRWSAEETARIVQERRTRPIKPGAEVFFIPKIEGG